MCDLVTDLDPRAEHVYRFAGLILPWEANEVDDGIRLLEKGVRNLPDAWELHYFLGMTRYFFKDDPDAAARDLGVAAQLPGAPPMVGRLAAVMRGRASDPATTVQFLRELLKNAESEQMKEVLSSSLQDAEFRMAAGAIDAAIGAYREKLGEAPPSLDALFARGIVKGQLPPEPFGGHWELDQATGRVRSSTGRAPRELHESGAVQGRHKSAMSAMTPTDR
jgi:hypothetical protein